jgi:hypothetical protein
MQSHEGAGRKVIRRNKQAEGSREAKSREKATTFLGSTTPNTPPGPFLLPAPLSPLSLSLLLASILVLSIRVLSVAGEREVVVVVVKRTEPLRGAGRDLGERRHGCSLLQALRLLVAAPLQIADAWYPPTAHCHPCPVVIWFRVDNFFSLMLVPCFVGGVF